MATATMTSTTIPYGSFGQPPPQSRAVTQTGSWSSVTTSGFSTKSVPGADDWSSYRMALPTTYAGTLAGYASGSSRPYDIYRLTAHVNVDLLNFLHSNEESFEARLMAGGYVGYGSSLGARMTPNAFMHAQAFAPSTAHPAPQLYAPQHHPLDERTMRKRRRLDAFLREPTSRPANLRPVEVEGRGRMLLDFAEEDEILQRTKSANSPSVSVDPKVNTMKEGLAWPDKQFPWSLRNHERIQRDRLEREDQLRCIERFLEVVSDEEDEEELEEDIFREAGYYSVVEGPVEGSSDVEVECSSGAATPSWMTSVQGAQRRLQPDPILSTSSSTIPMRDAQHPVRTNTMQLLAQRSLRQPCASH